MNLIREFSELWSKERSYRWYVYLLLLFWAWQLVFPTDVVDSNEYLQAASNLIAGNWPDSCSSNCDHWLHLTRRTLGYPVLLIVFGFFKPLLTFFQVFIAALTPIITMVVLRNYGITHRKLNRFVASLFLLYPLQYFYSGFLLPEVLSQFLLVLWLWFVLNNQWLKAGGALAVLVLLKPVFIVVIPVALLLLFTGKNRWGIAVGLLPVILISYLNFNKTNVWHYTSVAAENQYEYNNRAIINTLMTDAEVKLYLNRSDSAMAKMGFSEIYSYMKSEFRRNAIQHPKLYLWLHLKGSVLAMFDPGRYDLVAALGLENSGGAMGVKEKGSISKLFHQPWYILIFIILFTFINIIRWVLLAYGLLKFHIALWIPAAVIALLVAVTGPVGSARYVFPAMPLIIIIAAAGYAVMFKPNEKHTAHQ